MVSESGIICGMGSNNIILANQLGITQENSFFTINDANIFFIYDVPHIFKALRNMFLKYDFIFTEYHASFKYIKEFYEEDSKCNIRLAPKLTNSHITPSYFEEMKVRYAV